MFEQQRAFQNVTIVKKTHIIRRLTVLFKILSRGGIYNMWGWLFMFPHKLRHVMNYLQVQHRTPVNK